MPPKSVNQGKAPVKIPDTTPSKEIDDLQDTATSNPPNSMPKVTHKLLKERYEAGDPTIGVISSNNGNFHYHVILSDRFDPSKPVPNPNDIPQNALVPKSPQNLITLNKPSSSTHTSISKPSTSTNLALSNSFSTLSKNSNTSLIQSTQNPKTEWFTKTHFQSIITIEPGFEKIDPFDTAEALFGHNIFYKMFDSIKTPEYYQTILEATGSAFIKHEFSKQNPSEPSYSQCKIFKVLSPSEWYGTLTEPITFGEDYKNKPFATTYFNYFEYQQAWFNTFWITNKPNTHTWVFLFDRSANINTFPIWWSTWWENFGSITEIFPPIITRSFDLFATTYCPTERETFFSTIANFCTKFYAPWIFSWSLDIHHCPLPVLKRKFRVKWWGKCNIVKSIQPEQVKQWIQEDTKTKKIPAAQTPAQIKFQEQKTHIAALIASAKTPEEAYTIMQNHLKTASGETEDTESSTKDSCFGHSGF